MKNIKITRFKTLEEKIKIVEELFAGKTLSELSGEYDISQASIFNWSQNYEKLQARFEIEKSNKNLQKIVEKNVDSNTLNALIKSNLNLTNSIQKLTTLLSKK